MLKRSLLVATALATVVAFPAAAQSDDDITQSVAASKESAVSSVRLTAAGVKLVAGIAFAPVRRTIRESGDAAHAVADSGQVVNDSTGDKLYVSPETVQAQPAPKVPYEAQDAKPTDANTGGGQ